MFCRHPLCFLPGLRWCFKTAYGSNGTTLKTGRKELGILAYLHSHVGVVITRKELIHSVWGIHADIRSRSLDQYIVKVRAAFEKNGLSLDCFKTVHGIGYIFEPPAK